MIKCQFFPGGCNCKEDCLQKEIKKPMHQIIYKQVLSEAAVLTELFLPKSSQILSAQYQDDKIVFWYCFNKDDKEVRKYVFKVITTGSYYTVDKGIYLATVQSRWGLVYHIYYYS